MSDTVIKVENVSKKFSGDLKRGMFYGVLDVARSMMGIETKTDILRTNEFWSVDSVSFELKRGDTLGLIGVNGSGKTTLLRLLSGIYQPDMGRIEIRGRVGALISLGAGFHPLMTGRENVYLNGAILGLSKKEIHAKFNDIVNFADIGDFIDSPVKYYSSGMYVRLGFAIAIHAQPDILLVDEVLAVGDLGFQAKCYNKIGSLKEQGTATILVTHSMHLLAAFTKQALLLHKGQVEYLGDVDEAAIRFKKYFRKEFESEGEIEKVITGNDKIKIINVHLSPEGVMRSGGDFAARIEYVSFQDLDDIEIDLCLYVDIPSVESCFQATNRTFGKRLDIKKGQGVIRLSIKNISLNNIKSRLVIAIWEKERRQLIFWWRSIPLIFSLVNLSTGINHYEVDYEVIQ
jgi:lipopolysaccharide transport system ATP-binding protein